MQIIPGPVKKFLRRSDALADGYSKLRWQMHLLGDWWGTKVWKQTTEVATPFGFRLTSGIHPAYKMMREGSFEPEETALIQKCLGGVDAFVDIGANLGYYTCFALQKGKPTVAFEPQPQNLECLFQNLRANGWQDRAEVFPIALSEKPGLLTLYGASGPSASLVKDWAGYSSRFQRIVPVNALDNVLAGRFQGQRLLFKIDVEGAEYQVLSGARATLARTVKPMWLLEICLQEFHPEGMNPDYLKIFHFFWDQNYQAFTAAKAPKRVTADDVARWVKDKSCDSGTFNYMFVAPEDAAKLTA